jgi:hypothetical protein
MNIVREINQFYRIIGTECPKYKNIRVTKDDLKDEFILSEVLYDIEDNVYVYEGADELYEDVKYYADKKRYIYNAVKAIGIICIVIGFLTILGTAGASDLGQISMSQIISQISMGLIVAIVGFITIGGIKKW